MFSGGFTEIGFILFIAFLVFGPKKLPEIARILGKGMGELRRASDELKSSLEQEIRNLDRTDEEVTYSEEETHPYLEAEEETYDHDYEDAHEALGEETYGHHYEDAQEALGEGSHEEHPAVEETDAVSEQSESDPESTPEYGYDYSESPQHEPEPRG